MGWDYRASVTTPPLTGRRSVCPSQLAAVETCVLAQSQLVGGGKRIVRPCRGRVTYKDADLAAKGDHNKNRSAGRILRACQNWCERKTGASVPGLPDPGKRCASARGNMAPGKSRWALLSVVSWSCMMLVGEWSLWLRDICSTLGETRPRHYLLATPAVRAGQRPLC